MRKADILKIEKRLFQTWLDLSYAYEVNKDALDDMTFEVKELRKFTKQNKKHLDKAEKYYIELYGRKPTKRNNL